MVQSMHVRDELDQSIRWDVVAVIALISLVGVLGFKLLWMIEGYRAAVLKLPPDVILSIHPITRMVLVGVGVLIVYRMAKRGSQKTMGLVIGWSNAIKGIGIGFACTLPMLLLGLASDKFMPGKYEILHASLMPGLTEEIFYRAFMFGLLVQIARCPMWTTAIVTGVVFGLAHVSLTPGEGKTILGQINFGIAMIAVGGFMYAWIYHASKWNLWVVIACHTGMNLWWEVFELDKLPREYGAWLTLARIASIGLVVLFVMHFKMLGSPQRSTIKRE